MTKTRYSFRFFQTRVITAITVCLGVSLLSSHAYAAPAPSVVPGRNPLPQTRVDADSLVVQSSLTNVAESIGRLERSIRDLYREMNRHEEFDRWNGMFGPTSDLYGDYSPFDMIPIGPGLSSDIAEGPLLEPRPDVVKKDTADINQVSTSMFDLLQNTRLPSGAPDTLKARWEVMRSGCEQLKADLQKLNAFMQDPDYDQTKVSAFLKQYKDDAASLKDECKKMAHMLKREG